MGWIDDISQAECDGCGYKAIVKDKSKAPYWHDEKRIREGGVEDAFLLCGACHDKYLIEQRKEDEAFEVFMKGVRR